MREPYPMHPYDLENRWDFVTGVIVGGIFSTLFWAIVAVVLWRWL